MNAMTGQTPLEVLQRRMQLAEAMAYGPQQQSNGPVGAGLRGLAQILAARNANKLGVEVAETEKAQRASDLALAQAIFGGQGGDISQFSDPQLAMAALEWQARQNAPRDPVRMKPGEVLLDPSDYSVLAEGPAAPPSFVGGTGIDGVLFDKSSMRPYDVMSGRYLDGGGQAPQGVQGLAELMTPPVNPANPMGVNVAAPSVGGSGMPSVADRYETPQQARERDREAAVQQTRDAEQARMEVKKEAERAANIAAQPDLEVQNQIFLDTINDPNFSGAVGMIDQITGRIGAQFGRPEGVLGERVSRLATSMVLKAAESLSGAMSDKDIELLQETAPGRGDSPEVWRDWYSTEYLPRVNAGRQQLGLPKFDDPFKIGRAPVKGKRQVMKYEDGTEVEYTD
jgi:hypothetical protein